MECGLGQLMSGKGQVGIFLLLEARVAPSSVAPALDPLEVYDFRRVETVGNKDKIPQPIDPISQMTVSETTAPDDGKSGNLRLV